MSVDGGRRRPVADEDAVRGACVAEDATGGDQHQADLAARVLARLAAGYRVEDPERVRAIVARWLAEACVAAAAELADPWPPPPDEPFPSFDPNAEDDRPWAFEVV